MLNTEQSDNRDQYDTRALHLIEDLVTVEDASVTFQDVLARFANGNTLVVGRDKDPLAALLPETRQRCPGVSWDPLCLPKNADTFLGDSPTKSDERFPFETDGYDTVINIVQGHPMHLKLPVMMDMTRLCRAGGTILSATGLKPTEPPDHDFNGYVPQSDKATLESVHVTRHTDHRTPQLVSRFTCTLDGEFHSHEDDFKTAQQRLNADSGQE